MKTNWKKLNRKIHYWGSIAVVFPIIVVIVTGILLLLKKEFDWIQPPTVRGETRVPSLPFDEVINILSKHSVVSWKEVDRIDVRPNKGVMKISLKNRTEIQLDAKTGKVLQVAYRRSDLIESIHDGTFFHDKAKLWLFLPAAIVLLILWITGLYLFVITEVAKRRSKIKQQSNQPSLKSILSK